MREKPFTLPLSMGDVDATWSVPEGAQALIVLAHGAGANHQHKNMYDIACALFGQNIATLRFNFPFMQAGKRRVDSQPVAVQAIVDAVAFAHETHPELPLFLGGHSFGGRMATHAVAEHQLDVCGLVLCSFPLHVAKKPSVKRAAHLSQVELPMLFLSGTRDDLADPALLDEVTGALANTTVHWLDTANHSYVVLKRTRTNPRSVFEEIGEQCAQWITSCQNP